MKLLCQFCLVCVFASSLAVFCADDPPFNEAFFKATHNSYSGGEVGKIPAQLDAGVRHIELDIHDTGFGENHDYQIGHAWAGHEVSLGGGNPDTTLFREWLAMIRKWSEAHPGHSPITISIDLKSNLTNNATYAQGNLCFLNEELADAFGTRIFRSSEFKGKWPAVSELRNKVMFVMTGDSTCHRDYLWSEGTSAAASVNDKGQIVTVNGTANGILWYWTGQFDENGKVKWKRHGAYAKGTSPCVALNNDGWIIAMHESLTGGKLMQCVGKLDEKFEIEWRQPSAFDSGKTPSLRFKDPGALEFSEIHRNSEDTQNYSRNGKLETAKQQLEWIEAAAASTEARLHIRNIGKNEKNAICMSTMKQTKVCFTVGNTWERPVQYEQIIFIECQKGNERWLPHDSAFSAANAKNVETALEWRRKGRVVRLWDFNKLTPEILNAPIPPANFPATDNPFSAEYSAYCEKIGTIK